MGEILNYKKRAMQELGIDENVFDDLLRCFISEAEEQMQKLEEAVKADNFDEIAQIGHGLKGMAGNLRIANMQYAAKAMEAIAKEGKIKPEIRKKAIELRQYLLELKQQI